MTEEKDPLEFVSDELVPEETEMSTDGLTDEQKANLGNDGHFEFGEEASKEKKESDSKEDQKKTDTSSKESAEKKDQPDIKEELERTEKRRKDSERAFQKEHQEKLKLEKELEELKKKQSSQDKSTKSDDEDDDDLLFADDDDDVNLDEGDGQKKGKTTEDSDLKKEIDEVKQRQEELEKEQKLRLWEEEAAKVKDKHEDFDEVVYGIFYEDFEASPKLQKEFAEKGSTPEAAYELGLKLKRIADAIKDEDETKKETPERKENQNEEEDKKKTDTIDPAAALGGNSAGDSKSGGTIINDVSDAVNAALAEI